MNETTMLMDLVNAQQANQKLLRIIKNLKPTDLRDQFAMAALTGILANPKGPAGDWDKVSNDSYEAADAMLKAMEER